MTTCTVPALRESSVGSVRPSGPTADITRPVLRYYGGKFRIAPWIASHLPPHRCYVEPFCGAASVLLRKPRSYSEILNDIDETIVTLFRLLRDPVAAAELERLIRLTPYARRELEACFQRCEDPVENTRRLLVRSFMSFGSDGATRGCRNGFRNSSGGGHSQQTTPARQWMTWPEVIGPVTERLQGVCLECKPALELFRLYDAADTLFYVDPPYPHSTRNVAAKSGVTGRHGYRYEMTDDDHRVLARQLHSLKGMVVLSGYRSPLYDCELFPDWLRIERKALAEGARVRTECLYFNPAAALGVHPAFDFAGPHAAPAGDDLVIGDEGEDEYGDAA